MRLLLTLAVLALLAPGLSGCLKSHEKDAGTTMPSIDASPSPSKYAIKAPEEMWMTASDGVRINNAVYLPEGNGSWPVYINFSPYWADTAMTEGDNFAHYMVHEYVPRGFAVVLTAVRGTGHSEGCFEVGSDRELKDLDEDVSFFAKQAWSNGNVAAGAKSYDATSQNGMIAKFPNPALKGIFHVEGITDMYSYTFQEGVPARADSAAFNGEYGTTQGLSEYGPAGAVAGSPMDETPESLMRLSGDAACPEAPMNVANPGASTATGLKTPYWTERDWTRSIAGSSWNGSIFFVHGLQDWNVQPSHILPWLTEVQKNPHIEVFAWIHQWTANDQVGGDGHVYPKRTDWNATMLQWLDHILKGKDNGWTGGYEIEGTDLKWRASADWPNVPGSVLLNLTSSSGKLDLPAGTRVTGAPVLHVTATPMTPDPVIHATWYDTDASGKMTWVGEAVRRGALSDDLTGTRTITPGTAMPWTIQFYPMDTELQPGHTWSIVLGTQPNGAPGGGAGLVITPAQEQVQYDAGTMMVQVRTLDSEMGLDAVQPTLMKCFTC